MAHQAPHGSPVSPRIVLSFDVEEHFRIEAARGLPIDRAMMAHYEGRLETSTHWVLDQLADHQIQATFFVVGEIARRHPALIRAIAAAGHEVGSHSWEHRPLHLLSPSAFERDLVQSKDVLEQVIGKPVLGYRAPTFSIVRKTAWALDILAEQGFVYDSSIYPVRHDRYGVPQAPRGPFKARGWDQDILELPAATWQILGSKLPVGGGGYFRLFPTFFLDWALEQIQRQVRPAVAMLYFHPWEFDPGQSRLPLNWLNRFRTYVGIFRSRPRLATLLSNYRFCRAIDVARELVCEDLPGFQVGVENLGEKIHLPRSTSRKPRFEKRPIPVPVS